MKLGVLAIAAFGAVGCTFGSGAGEGIGIPRDMVDRTEKRSDDFSSVP